MDSALFYFAEGCSGAGLVVDIGETHPSFPYELIDTRIERDADGGRAFVVLAEGAYGLAAAADREPAGSPSAIGIQLVAMETAEPEAPSSDFSDLPPNLRPCGR